MLPTSSGLVLLCLILCLTTVLKASTGDHNSKLNDDTRLILDLDENGLVNIDPQDALDHIGETGSFTSLLATPSSFSCADIGDGTIVITASRADGSNASFNIDVTVRDVSPPVLVLSEAELVLDANGMGTLNWWDIVDTTCDGLGENCTKDNCSINYTLSQSEFTCTDIGQKSISVTATDAGGNSISESVNITIVDNLAPVLVLKNGTAGLNNLGRYTLQEFRVVDTICDSEGNNCTKDACGYTLSFSKREFTCEDLGDHVITVTATDASGNSTTGTLNFTIIDGLFPVVQTKNATLALGEDGTVELEPEMIDNGSFDNCSNITLSVNKSVFNCADIGNHTVTLTVTDDRGRESSKTATVTIVDNIQPVVVTQNIAIDLDPVLGYTDIDPKDILVICPDAIIEEPTGGIDFFVPGSGDEETVYYRVIEFEDCTKDNCKITNLTVDKQRFTVDDIGDNVVSIYVFDESGNLTTGSAIVKVNDNIAPTAVSKNITIDLDANGVANITANDIDDGSSDNVSVILSIDKSSFSCTDVGENIVTLTVADPSGNTTVTTSTVTVRDVISPVIVPKNLTLELNASGTATITAAELYESIQEGCEIASIVASKVNFSCTELGDNTVSITVDDIHGNQSVVESIVTVVDMTGPVVIGKNLEVNLGVEGSVELTADQLYESVTDNCSLAGVSLSKSEFSCTDLGENDIAITAIDSEGNSTVVTVKVTVIDDIAPILITKPFATGLNTLGQIEISVRNVVDLLCDAGGENCSRDNCDVSYSLSRTQFDCSDVGVHTITVTATDQAGNVSMGTSEVTIINGGRPRARGKDVTIELGPDGITELDPVELDNGSSTICGGLQYSASKSMFNCADIGTQTINFTVTDDRGYTESVPVNVTIADSAPPVVVTKNIEVRLGEDNRAVIEEVDLLNLCPDVVIETGGGEDTDEFVPGEGNGNSIIEKIIEVKDGCTRDNCTISAVSASKVLFTQDDIGDNEVTVHVFDESGNSATGIAIVSVVDNIPPVALKRDLLIDLLPDGRVTIDVDRVDAGSTDNIGVVSRTLSQYDFDCSDVGVNQVLLTISDAAGNETVVTSNITIRDQTAPVLQLKDITVSLSDNGIAEITASDVDDGSADACGLVALSLDRTTFSCADIGSNSINVTATDANGLETTGTVLVTIVDAVPVIVPRNITVDLDEARDGQGKVSITSEDIVESIVDNCGTASLSLSKQDFTCADIGNNTVIITATDEQGNEGTAEAIVTVRDVTPPSIEFNNLGFNLEEEELRVPAANFIQSVCIPGIPNNLQPCTHDNCSISVTISKDGVNFIPLDGEIVLNCNDVGGLNITARAEDGSGNVTQESRDYVVQSTKKPEIIPKNYVAQLDASGIVTIQPQDVYESVTDVCGISSITVSQLSFDCSDQGNNPVTITATDIFGNVQTASATVDVVYEHLPVVIPKDITIDLDETRDGQGKASISPGDLYTLENDNCVSVNVSLSKQDFTCSDLGPNEVTITAVDGKGNEVVVIATVTVRDITPPFIAFNQLGFNLHQEEWAIPASNFIKSFCLPGRTNSNQPCTNDNCSVSVTVSKDGVNFVNLDGEIVLNCNDVGGLNITVRAEDGSGNVTQETRAFELRSTRRPDIVPKDITVVLDENGSSSIDQDEVYESVTDICGISSITVSPLNFSCEDIGTNEVTITATDIFGNVQTSTSTVTVVDETGPRIETVNVTVDLNADGEANLSTGDVYSTIIDNCSGFKNVAASKNTFNCSDLGENEILVTAEDDYGNTGTASVVVTVRDVTGPEVKTKNIEVELDESGTARIIADDLDNGSNDSCGIVTFSLDKQEFQCGDIGENTVTLTAEDGSGNKNSMTAVVTVVDKSVPIVKTKDISLELDQTGKVTVSEESLYDQVTDNCAVHSVVASKLSFDCSNVGVNEVVVTAIDTHGNESSAISKVTIEDTSGPNVQVKDVEISLDERGIASLSAEALDNGSSDPCGISSFSVSKAEFTCDDLGENQVTLTVTDLNGNVNQAIGVVTVIDETAPVISSRDVEVELNASGSVTIEESQFYDTVTDNCKVGLITVSKLNFDCSDIGEHTVTITATDESGNQQIATSTVIVRDLIPPVVNTNNITVLLDESGLGSVSAADIDNGSHDNCGVKNISIDKSTFDCGDLGENTVTLTVTDVNGNESQGVATVTVKDETRPIIKALDLLIDLEPSGSVTITEHQLYSQITDNCDVVTILASKLSFDCSNIGANEVTITAIDGSGNEQTAVSTVTVRDVTGPEVRTKNFDIVLDEKGYASITAEDLNDGSFDPCGIAAVRIDKREFSCDDLGANQVTLTVTDQSGNESQGTATVTVKDETAPVILVKEASIELDASGTFTIETRDLYQEVRDNCSVASVVASKLTFDCSDVGENDVTLTITDISGNKHTATSKVTVTDTNVPVVVTKNITVSLDEAGNASISAAEVDNGSSDPCGIAAFNLDRDTFTCADIGENRVTLTVTDKNGNSNVGIVTVTVSDEIKPLVIPKDIVVDLDRTGKVTVLPHQLYHEVRDNCTVESVSASKLNFTCNDIGVNEVTLTINDAQGNLVETTARVTVGDGIAPVVMAKNATVVLDNNGNGSITVDDINNGSTDACGIRHISLSKNMFNCNDLGEQIVELIVEDVHGNIARSTAIVTVVDRTAPVLELKSTEVILNQEGKGILQLSQIVVSEVDNCGIELTKLSKSEFNCQDVGEQEVVVTSVDSSGNVVEQRITVSIKDETKPAVTAKSITVELDRLGQAVVLAESLDNGSADACGIKSFSLDKESFSCNDLGENRVILSVEDNNGNVGSSAAIVTIVDKILPVIEPKSVELELDDSGKVLIEPAQLYKTVTDNCGVQEVIISQREFSCDDIGDNTVVITAKDKSGNQQSAEVSVKIRDSRAPVIITKSVNLNLDNLGNAVLDPDQIDNGSYDTCGPVTLMVDKTDFNCDDIGEQEVLVRAIDQHGNESVASQKITISDNRGPSIIAKDITLELGVDGVKEINASVLYSSITDNCSLDRVVASQLSFDCGDIGEQTVTLQAFDKNGNVSQAESKVLVVDRTAPIVLTKNLELALDENGIATISNEDIDNGSHDNCAIATYELSKTRFSCSEVGLNEVSLKVTDINGNSAEATAIVTVLDNMAPVIVPDDYILNLDVEGRARLNPQDVYSSIIDNCQLKSVVVAPLAFSCADLGEHVITITATDVNDNVSQRETKVTVRDINGPIIRTKDITVELDVSGKAVIRPLDIDNGSLDNCGLTLSLDKHEFDCGDVGVNNVVLTGIDPSGNQSTGVARVTVLGDNDIVMAVNVLTLSPLDAVCENADIVVTLESTFENLIYSLVDANGQLLGKGLGTNGALQISLSEEVIDTEWTVEVSNENGCKVTSNVTGRIVNAAPISADFYRQGNGEILVDVPVQFHDQSIGQVISWQWTSDGRSYEGQDPLITFRQQGVRSVRLLVESNEDCSAERIRNYTVEGEWMAEAPTAFSPNAVLPENRIFKVITRGLREEKLTIYDRSGRVVHQGENEWSGTITVGGDIIPGPYLFEFHAKTVNGVPIFKRGRFMLF